MPEDQAPSPTAAPMGETRPYLWTSHLHPEQSGRGEGDSVALWLSKRAALLDGLNVIYDLMAEKGGPTKPDDLEARKDDELEDEFWRAHRALGDYSQATVTIHQAVAEAEPMISIVRRLKAAGVQN